MALCHCASVANLSPCHSNWSVRNSRPAVAEADAGREGEAPGPHRLEGVQDGGCGRHCSGGASGAGTGTGIWDAGSTNFTLFYIRIQGLSPNSVQFHPPPPCWYLYSNRCWLQLYLARKKLQMRFYGRFSFFWSVIIGLNNGNELHTSQ
jgi:hypothetical protein